MPQIAPIPGTGINRETGAVLAGWPHVQQSLGVIFSTAFGERVMRRWFGSAVPALLGRNLINSTVLRFWTAICTAIDLWEPRFRITKITALASATEARAGKIGFALVGVYYPRGHLGDYTLAIPKTVTIGRVGTSLGVVP
jgi:hypothetical protein